MLMAGVWGPMLVSDEGANVLALFVVEGELAPRVVDEVLLSESSEWC